ncbi:LacI family DNA-binding transcriptional regulator [Jonesia denitrificans]|uniref:Transcriptional regulator, LacI family n=1 Tax=Jonesia denitrificans (strain ATCC 14870 / DSM 20603 / BCRC 15368 / CIP 55.134 / JCM 11481 / NBRC 15587 / NCTC 10816 / Prevot 55134) TaxID=471856 RepID=C7R364_JONDD|nr:LacI family DNA-binding transcriptional regulator [Jonesia denitrificans]ACV10112.1 transcriptional regulator, LacI family [Jonesia denitrificans DSM 20603]QXB43270.1 LacI family DNA-binding transcriptional regulator [Jonesia denitrificans]SQH22986.1 Ribose operon repressor [Jonesia denitrificans]
MRTHRQSGPTLADVARRAGVSTPTVSRVLGGKVPVSAAKRDAVNAAIAELGYRPDPAARALARGQRTMVGVIAHNTTRFGYAATLEGIQRAAAERGLSVAIAVVESDSDADIDRAVDVLLAQPVLGVVAIVFDSMSRRAVERLPHHVLRVAAGGAVDGVASVLFDDDAVGALATQFLLDAGHETVYHLAMPHDPASGGRHAGWRAALERAEVSVPPLVTCTYDPQSAYEAAGGLVSGVRSGEVTAVLCGNDVLALGVYARFADEGVRIPEDVSVVGCDDEQFAVMLRPSLTTVRQDFRAMGARAVELLTDVLPSVGGTGARVADVEFCDAVLVQRGSHRVV